MVFFIKVTITLDDNPPKKTFIVEHVYQLRKVMYFTFINSEIINNRRGFVF